MFGLIPRSKRMMTPLPRTETPLGWIAEEFAPLFNRFFSSLPVPETWEWPYTWGLTTEDKEKEIVTRIEMPGFETKELKLEVLGDRLTVEAEHKVPAEKPEETGERTYVKRVVVLPPDIEPEKLEAIYRNGVLEVHMPRKPEAVGRRIEVKT